MEKILLIIDDDPEIIEVLREILKDEFDGVMSSASVDEALKKLNETVFSFMILDIRLSSRNGAEVLKYLSDNPENANNNCPVLILSGVITNEFVEKFSSRFVGIIMKPFNHDELVSEVKTFFAREMVDKISDEASSENFPEAPCELPFPILDLKQKVSSVLDEMKKNTKIK